ncbi:RluA family pseudouridine synthase [Paenibacillus mucilaginosus 3016]|uniref:Pseudouridine synthase n=1 Tax=Paenibacillus mucilaginosus 3016 TaxID=1116391 RepID=H6NTC1_9BACL|nr:RluA family pseudouridine synthase [Paenibacillus mucilaginosus]AFC27583.1 RluA family pseudouridine synthase [Paenibacillus mucilaginosus 3016]
MTNKPTSSRWTGRPSGGSKERRGGKPARPARPSRPAARSTGARQAAAGTGAPRQAPKARILPVQEAGELLNFLLAHLNMGRNAVKSLLARGQVSVNGRTVTVYNHPLLPGQSVTVSKERIVEAPPLIGLTILHEDSDIIVVRKEAGLLSIASAQAQEEELTAYRQLMAHVRHQDPSGRIFVVHRLDRDTSGVMLFAKSEQAQQTLQNAWQEMVQERTYVALVDGMVKKPEGTVKSWLKESSTLKMYSSPYPNDGQLAITHYKVLQAAKDFSLLEVNLETGRKNQIRVHMQDIGHPIAGDRKYGSKSRTLNRLGLHARVIAFTHPMTGELMRFETEIPKAFLGPLKGSSLK